MPRQTITIPNTPPALSIFTTAAPLSEISGTTQGSLGDDTFQVPDWTCGLDLIAYNDCIPAIMPIGGCNSGASNNIEIDWPDGGVEADGITKIFGRDECKKYSFNPIQQAVPRYGTHPCFDEQSLLGKASQDLDAGSHHNTAVNLETGFNGNPALPYYAKNLTPDGKVDACVGLGFLHAALRTRGSIVAPISTLAALFADNQIFYNNNQILDTALNTVVTDTGITGQYGPPAAPWDGQTPIGVNDLQQAEPGCKWVYGVAGLWAGTTLSQSPVTKDEKDENDVKRNEIAVIPEIKSLAVFNPCEVYAALINTNKKAGC